jgi:hypothetical protein
VKYSGDGTRDSFVLILWWKAEEGIKAFESQYIVMLAIQSLMK